RRGQHDERGPGKTAPDPRRRGRRERRRRILRAERRECDVRDRTGGEPERSGAPEHGGAKVARSRTARTSREQATVALSVALSAVLSGGGWSRLSALGGRMKRFVAALIAIGTCVGLG